MDTKFMKVLKKAKKSLKAYSFKKPETAIVLGSGLSDFVKNIHGVEIPFYKIKGFPTAGVRGHMGILKIGGGIAISAGRFHYYEGHSIDTVCLPIFLLHRLGVKRIILTNAAGGINPEFSPGELVLIKDHLNMIGTNPLRGQNIEKLGPRFPDLSAAYTPDLRKMVQEITPLKEGVYAAMPGPCYETPAEVAMLKTLGADMVGMSTVPEAIAASYLGMEVMGLSCITNMAAGISETPLNHQEVIEAGKKASGNIKELLMNLLNKLGHETL